MRSDCAGVWGAAPKMLVVKLTPTCLDTSSLLLALIVFWWLCRLCTAMKTLCDAEPCTCDFVGRINCACRGGGAQVKGLLPPLWQWRIQEGAGGTSPPPIEIQKKVNSLKKG